MGKISYFDTLFVKTRVYLKQNFYNLNFFYTGLNCYSQK